MTNKNRMFAMRISDTELAAIKCKAVRAKLNTSEYIIKSALEKPIVVVDGLDRVMGELKYIGSNLNQLATLCNMGKITCLDLNETRQDFGRVFDYLYHLPESR